MCRRWNVNDSDAQNTSQKTMVRRCEGFSTITSKTVNLLYLSFSLSVGHANLCRPQSGSTLWALLLLTSVLIKLAIHTSKFVCSAIRDAGVVGLLALKKEEIWDDSGHLHHKVTGSSADNFDRWIKRSKPLHLMWSDPEKTDENGTFCCCS